MTRTWLVGTAMDLAHTGDTVLSRAVEELAKGADLLVTVMIDVEYTVANVRRD